MSNDIFAPPTSSPFPAVGYPRTSPLGHLHLTPPLDSSLPFSSLSSPSNPTLSHTMAVPYTDSKEGTIGPSPIEAKYGVTGSGQSFLPMMPLDSPSLTSDHSPYIKEEDQEWHLGTSSMWLVICRGPTTRTGSLPGRSRVRVSVTQSWPSSDPDQWRRCRVTLHFLYGFLAQYAHLRFAINAWPPSWMAPD